MDICFDRVADVDKSADALESVDGIGRQDLVMVPDIVAELPVLEPIGMELELVDDNYRFADNEHAQMETVDDAAETVYID